MISNFEFLKKDFPVLANFGELAERYCFSDSNSCLMKLGMMGETIVNLMFTYDKVALPMENTAVMRINTLQKEGLLSWDLADILHALRKVRNKAAHENYDSVSDSKSLLEMTFGLCEWFMQTYGDWNYKSQKFMMPPETKEIADEAKKRAENQAAERLQLEAEKVAETAPYISIEQRKQRAGRVANQRRKSEAETRYMIDEQLRQVGWEANSEELRYAKGVHPKKGRNLAIAEWPTDSKFSRNGYADYALFIGLQLVGIIEAKAEHVDIPSVLDYQGKEYLSQIKEEHAQYQVGSWQEYKVPFSFATNGRPYLEQLKTKSGIWFLDLREAANAPKALHGWISPEGILELLEKDIAAGNQKLADMPYDLLTDKDGLNLRPYQLRAIQAVEEAVVAGREKVLLAMATGTGKTRTILGMIYRFLKTNRFQRILFLVDRTALGEQAQDVFREVKLEDLMTLNEIYNIKNLEDKTIEKETRIQVATVQSLVKRIIYHDGESMPAVTDYDLIIIDEAHRGYILDKEMGEMESLYRDQRDYQSKYRSVVDYFDAVKIALTATPALHTTEIFGEPVFRYSYREAVIEGYLVDHDAPHHLETKLSSKGIHYKSGDMVAVYDPVTGEITNSQLLQDELDFEVEHFNRQVITENFNRAVLEEIARNIDPDNPEEQGKTLIYAVDDSHADMIVSILKEIYSQRGVDNDAIMKITGSVGGGNPKKVQEAIRRFKNERFPSVAVTVDLLTTGIDVPEITVLVFMRRVKSRILFEQMLGRATRLCPRIKKMCFEIYDPVRLYDSIESLSTMKPVVVNPSIGFLELAQGIEELEEDDYIREQINQIVAKLQRQKRNMTTETLEHFISMTNGKNPTQFIEELQGHPAPKAKDYILKHRDVFAMLEQRQEGCKKAVVVSGEPDQLLTHTRGYGKSSRPEDYLQAFAEYIQSNLNEIAALKVVCTRPKELTRESLKNLRLTLDREGFTTKQLNTAISEMTNQEMAADIISLIRRYVLGSALISHEARVRRAVDKLKRAHNFSKQELNWIVRMEKYLLEESVLNMGVFEEDGRFKSAGGIQKIDQVFQGQLENIVVELNEYLYDDGGRSA